MNTHELTNSFLGVCPPDESEFQQIIIKAKEAIKRGLVSASHSVNNTEDQEAIVLALVYISTKIGNNANQFWPSIQTFLDYDKSDWTTIYNEIIRDVLPRYCKSKGYFLIKGPVRNEYRLTLLAHAIAPNDSFFSLLEFLWDVYENDLDACFTPGDSIVDSILNFFHALHEKEDINDDQISIGGRIYKLRAQYKALLSQHPNLMRDQLNLILQWFEDEYWHDQLPNDDSRFGILFRDWWKQKLSSYIITQKLKGREGRHTICWSQFNPYFRWYNEKLFIEIPNTRLPKQEFSSCNLLITFDGNNKKLIRLDTFGGIIQHSIRAKSIAIENLSLSVVLPLKLFIQILLDDKVIYDKQLYREALAFDVEGYEVKRFACGEQMPIIVLTGPDDIVECSNYECHIKPLKGMDRHETYLKNDGVLFLNGHAWRQVNALRHDTCQCITPVIEGASYTKHGRNYDIVDRFPVLQIMITESAKIQHYKINVGEMLFRLDMLIHNKSDDIYAEVVEDSCFIHLNSMQLIDGKTITVTNMAENKLILVLDIILIENYKANFNKELYFGETNQGTLSVHWCDYNEVRSFTPSEPILTNPWRDGEVRIVVPLLRWRLHTRIEPSRNNDWESSTLKRMIWHESIANEELLEINHPAGIQPQLLIDKNTPINAVKHTGTNSIFHLGEQLRYHKHSQQKESNIAILVADKEFQLFKIVYAPCFVGEPVVWVLFGCLYWNMSYVGPEESRFILSIDQGGSNKITYPTTKKSGTYKGVYLDDGTFTLRVDCEYDDLFVKSTQNLYECILLNGDPSLIRFKGKKIRITYVNEDNNEENLHSVRKFYIGKINFDKKIEKFTGQAFTIQNDGKIFWIYKFNPVFFKVDGNTIIDLTNSEGASLFYDVSLGHIVNDQYYEDHQYIFPSNFFFTEYED